MAENVEIYDSKKDPKRAKSKDQDGNMRTGQLKTKVLSSISFVGR